MNIIINNIKQNWLLICIVMIVMITSLSLAPLQQLPSMPGSDKTHHFLAYAVLFFPVALAKPKHWFLIGIAFITISGAIELIQPYVNRYGEWLDLLSNSGGILCGYIIARLTDKLVTKNTRNISIN